MVVLENTFILLPKVKLLFWEDWEGFDTKKMIVLK